MAGLTRGAVAVSAAVLMLALATLASAGHDYGDALSKSILFFEAQRSGYLPPNQRVKWRADSGLRDGKVSGVDLVGGYYDAGDNVKFGLPMAFTVTMMSWSILEYGRQLASAGELGHATAAVRWGTDYLIKAHPEPYVLYGEVGDGNTDHYCWQRPEDMTTSRAAYRIDVHNPGSDLAGETAAAMAAASLVFRRFDPAYSAELLTHAKQLFEFADKYRGKYDSSITVARKYYGSFSGYADELLWASAWLYQATNQDYYLDYLVNNADALGGTGWSMTEFGWDVKYAGAQILASKFLMQGRGGARHAATLAKYQRQADFFTCACLGKGTRNVRRTPGGLLFRQRWNNMQFVTSASFLLTVYSDYMTSSGRSGLRCASGYAAPAELVGFARSQVDYILGDNPRATSYMVGYGANYPKQVHHRGSSIVSIKVDPSFVSCRGGYDTWYGKKSGDPNLLVGALVGGPDAYDDFADERDNFEQTEPATYNNAPVLGLLARLAGGHDGYNQLLPDLIPAPVSEMPPPAAKTTNPIPVPKSSPVSHAPAAKLKSFGAGAVTVEQKVTASWSHRGKTYYRYSTIVSNNSPDKPLKNLQIDISKLYGPVWGLTGGRQARGTAGGRYRFPQWLDTLPAGKSMEFVYIHAAPQAQVSVAGYTLG